MAEALANIRQKLSQLQVAKHHIYKIDVLIRLMLYSSLVETYAYSRGIGLQTITLDHISGQCTAVRPLTG